MTHMIQILLGNYVTNEKNEIGSVERNFKHACVFVFKLNFYFNFYLFIVISFLDNIIFYAKQRSSGKEQNPLRCFTAVIQKCL